MSDIVAPSPLRAMTTADIPAVLGIQQPGAVQALSDVFPQDAYPFPRDDVAQRWVQEIAAPGAYCFVALPDGVVEGFAAIRGDEFLHFGIAVERWGSGLAQIAHDAVLEFMRSPRPAGPRLPHRHRRRRTRRTPAPTAQIPLTRNEISHLFAAHLLRPLQTLDQRLHWSSWRRRHQHRARASHYQRQATRQP